MRYPHSTLILIAATLWISIGSWLLLLGMGLLFFTPADGEVTPLLLSLESFFGGKAGAQLFLFSLALILGGVKGRWVLSKAAAKTIARIRSLPHPAPLKMLYPAYYYLLIAFMMSLGVMMRLLGIPNDIRGAIDLAVGSGLIIGSISYFRAAFSSPSLQENR